MYVKDAMTKDVVTIFSDASIDLAFQTMVEKGCKQLPVVKDGKLVGLITEQLLSEVSPSKATTLSIYELNYLLSKTKVSSIMTKDMPIGNPDMLIEEAASLMKSRDVDALPITDNDQLIGIITRTDILDAFLELTGMEDEGTRISLEINDATGVLATIAQIISLHGINIIHVANYNRIGTMNHGELVIRVATHQVDNLLISFREAGYKILDVRKTQLPSIN